MAKIRTRVCPECGETYDVYLHRCPHCHASNDERPNTRMTFLPSPRQVSLFLVGLLGIEFISVLFSILFTTVYKEDQAYGYLLINTFTYITLFIIMVFILAKYFNEIFIPFKKGRTYLAGLIGGTALIGCSMLVSLIMSVIVPDAGTGENQSIAVAMILNNPLVCYLILGLIGPFVEECAYRLGLFSLNRRLSRVLAYLLTVLIFTVIHLDFFSDDILSELVALPDYLIAATIFCVLYEYEGFGAGFIAHAINNIFSVSMVLLQARLG